MSQECSNLAVAGASLSAQVILFTRIANAGQMRREHGESVFEQLRSRHHVLFQELLAKFPGIELVQDTGDGFYVRTPSPEDAVDLALRFQRLVRDAHWPGSRPGIAVGINQGVIHCLEGTDRHAKYVGTAIDLAARVAALAGRGQILLTQGVWDAVRRAVGGMRADFPLSWLAHGEYRFKGMPLPCPIYELGEEPEAALRLPKAGHKARRVSESEQTSSSGWRPAAGQLLPQDRNWHLCAFLGAGSVGEVWLAQHAQTGLRHVFKFCFERSKLILLRREADLFARIRRLLGCRDDIAHLVRACLDQHPCYLEMDYYAAGDLVQWFAAHGDRFEPSQRIVFLAAVARAVAAAHSIGILHKDIKPLNLLIECGDDGPPRPRLADFGIGELRGLAMQEADPGGESARTSSRSSAGSRMYVPPEVMAGAAASAQGDVYALGVTLYQLIIGDLARPLADGWERNVSDPLLRADIAACVDGDPARRFSSAAELAERLESLPQRREQERSRARARQQTRRRVRMRKRLAIGVLLLGMVTVALSLAWQREQELRLEAERETQTARAASSFMVDLFALGAPPHHALPMYTPRTAAALSAHGRRQHELPARALLDHASVRLRTELLDQPAVRSDLIDTVGYVYQQLGMYDEAIEQFRIALGIRSDLMSTPKEDLAESENNLAVALMFTSAYTEAAPHLRRALELNTQAFGRESHQVASNLNNLAHINKEAGDRAGAIALFREAHAINTRLLGDGCAKCALNIFNLAQTLQEMGRYEEAELQYRQALAQRRALFEEPHPAIADSLYGVADVLAARGELGQAERKLHELIEMDRKLLGDQHPHIATDLFELGEILLAQDRAAAALDPLREALAIRERVFSADSPISAVVHRALAQTMLALQRPDEAQIHARNASAVLATAPGFSDAWALSLTVQGEIAALQGHSATADRYYAHALRLIQRDDAATALRRGVILMRIARHHLDRGRARDAHQHALRARDLLQPQLPAEHPRLQSLTDLLRELTLQADAGAERDGM